METFEAGVNCTWTGHTFRPGEQARKCVQCPRVMKISAWEERRRCFCGSTETVLALARLSTNPVQIQTNAAQTAFTYRGSENHTIETFEAGINCVYTAHSFTSGERGIKCLNCQRVMTISAWNERRRCFCGSTNVVEAIATTLNPTILTTNPRHNPQTSGTSNAQRTHINWRDTTSAQNLSSSQIPSNPNNPRRNDTFPAQLGASFFKWLGYVSAGAFLFLIIYATPLKNLADPSFWQSLLRKTAVESNSQLAPIPNYHQNKDDLNSEKGLKYMNLQKLLAAGNWFEADKETEQVMLQAVGLKESNSISYKRLSSFSCTDLRTIDNLWKKYSNGRFGFSVQKEIYLSAGGKPDSNYYVKAWNNFGDRTGWRVKGEWINYGSLEGINFSTSAPLGHLPYKAHLTMGARRLNDLGFFPRTYSCNL